MELTDNMVNQPGKEILFAHFASNLLKSGELDAAIKVCEKGLKKFPTYAQAHYILARCYIRKKLNDEARAELERVLRYEPNHIKAIRDLAGLHFTNGFQDLYKEYLMQLFTLDPMNDNVIEEAKKLGEYNLWSADTNSSPKAEPAVEPENVPDKKEEKEEVFIDSDKEKESPSDPDPIFPDKIDLSQFDNVDDDFTTILHGKIEYSHQLRQPKPEGDPDIAKIADSIVEDPALKSAEESIPPESQKEQSQDEPKTSEEESAESKETINVKPDQEPSVQAMDSTPETDPTSDVSEVSAGPSNQKESSEQSDSVTDDYPDEDDEKFEQPKIISQTLGEILVSQQKYAEAKAVFEALKEKQPDNKALDLKIEYLDRIIGLEKEGKA